MGKNNGYRAALRYDWLTGLYDIFMERLWIVRKMREALIHQANTQDRDIVLDFGCGTGGVALMVKKCVPKAIVHGLDVDPKILGIAKRKAKRNGVEVSFALYDGVVFPYGDETFDKVISSIVFHHLTQDQKQRALLEIKRVLKPGGELLILDFGKPHNLLMRALFLPVQLLDGFGQTAENVRGLLPGIIQGAGFHDVSVSCRFVTPLGSIVLYWAGKGRGGGQGP